MFSPSYFLSSIILYHTDIVRQYFPDTPYSLLYPENIKTKNDRFETHCVLNRSFQLFPINYHDNALNSLHTVERIQNARNSPVILFYTTISSKRFSAIEFTAFKNIFSLGIFKALYINSHPFKSYFIRYYFSYNHIKALSIISSYISKTGVNVVYMHYIHRSTP